MSDFNPESVYLCSSWDQSASSNILPHSFHVKFIAAALCVALVWPMAARYSSHGPLRFVSSHSRFAHP